RPHTARLDAAALPRTTISRTASGSGLVPRRGAPAPRARRRRRTARPGQTRAARTFRRRFPMKARLSGILLLLLFTVLALRTPSHGGRPRDDGGGGFDKAINQNAAQMLDQGR